MQCSQKVGQKKWSHNSSQKTSRTSTPSPPLQKVLLKVWNDIRNFFRLRKFRSAVYTSIFIRTAVKLVNTCFRRFPTFHFSTPKTKNKIGKHFRSKISFRKFIEVFEELRPNGPQNQILRQILLQIHIFWGLYDQKSWEKKVKFIVWWYCDISIVWFYDKMRVWKCKLTVLDELCFFRVITIIQ